MRINGKMFVQAVTDIETPIKAAKMSQWKNRTVQVISVDGAREIAGKIFRTVKEAFVPPTSQEREVRELKAEASSIWKGFKQIICAPAVPFVSFKYQYLKGNADLDVPLLKGSEAYSKLNKIDKAILGLYSNRVSVLKAESIWKDW
ncbi:hypothetical protein M3P05_02225 [Sansalvadorimonas sp. 2012CJ34-2]|uniref:Uncharacterized protein n=1 Tax=Parendozoicomonas callyspongiae TaxID=2942213 RepID=A0ABT0PCJ5_9GAMM|nr:hypothetical protein [Sansalvadorimonas sp. 2012CJ34-2]MCL6268766.1 hypothetical protein [Sansalvadorimonas sp. 2012CJ34-2]